MNLKNIIENWKNPKQFKQNISIEKEDILKILEAARWAPSAINQQVCRFLVVDNVEGKEVIVKSIEEKDVRLIANKNKIKTPILTNSFIFSPDNYDLRTDKYIDSLLSANIDDLKCSKVASTFIICIHTPKYLGKSLGMTDMGASIANIILISKQLGFDVRWIRNFNREKIREKYNIPKKLFIDTILAIGKSTENDNEPKLRKEIYKKMCFFNKWNNINSINFNLGKEDHQEYGIDVIDTILDRRSIRKYFEEKSVPFGIILKLIEAGLIIPLTIQEPYVKIIIVNDKEVLSEISKHAKYIVHQSFVSKAPLIIAIAFYCSNNCAAFYGETDTGAIMQNILLRAHSLGIGSCWIGGFNRKKVKNILNIPKDWHLPSISILGFSRDYPKPCPRFEIGKIGYYNGWKLNIQETTVKWSPKNYLLSMIMKKLTNTKVKSILRDRKVGEIEKIPEFIFK